MRTKSPQAGFTLAELLVSMSLGLMIMVAVLSTYLFLGRNLAKTANLQILENKSRLALNYLSRDIRLASAVSSPTSTSLTLTLPGSGTVTYTYSSSTLTRSATFGAYQTNLLLAGDCTSLSFNYYSTTGTALTSTALVPLSVKFIEFAYTLERGTPGDGTFAQLQTVSSRYFLSNKQLPNGT